MALLPLNTFKTRTAVLTTGTLTKVYTAPAGVTAVILMANAANVDTNTHLVTFAHYRNIPVAPDAQGNGAQAPNTLTELVTGFPVPPNNAANLIAGSKMVIEAFDSIIAYCETGAVVKLTMSILETANA